ncbi:MAG: dihydroorotase [Candidatus Binatia bacterium]|nr:dihydroorotase [Candidatus Binatia bacterium]
MSDRDLLVRGGRVVSPDSVTDADVWIEGGRVKAVGTRLAAPEGTPEIDAGGKLVLPGLIDPQVHFREPGNTHKEDLASGSLAAIAGGVTSFLEMPNTKPSTTTPELLTDKFERAKGRTHADHGFFLGASAENAEHLGEWEQAPGCAGVKVFMGSSTGSLLVADDETLERVLRSGSRRVAVHSEDEPRLIERYAAIQPGTPVTEHPNVRDVECAVRATRRLLDLVERTKRPVHLLHVSTAEEIALLRDRDLGELLTAEVTPNHLFLTAPDCYERFGSRVQMNPPVRVVRHRDTLREALADGTLSCIGSDHAPHAPDEKAKPYPECPSGIPGVQTILGLLLTAVRDGWLRLEDVARVSCSAPARVYGIQRKGGLAPGMDGDLVVVDADERGPLQREWLRSRAGYSPYEGAALAGWPLVTVLRGRIAYRDHAPVGAADGQPIQFG